MRVKTEIPTSTHRSGTAEAYVKAVERVIGHMKEHLEEPLDLDELAPIAAISKFHLVRIFDEITGTTPRHFLACLRIQQAKQLLLSSRASITDICMEVGYTSLGSFSKTFSFLVGLSPQDFRAMPKRLDAMQFAGAVWRFLASKRKDSGPQIEGIVEGPAKPRGFTFVGTFTKGVPQGVPYSGTVLLTRGTFRIKRPAMPEFHLMAVLVPFTANLTDMVTTLPVGLVASLRVQNQGNDAGAIPRLRLRPLCATDPPIVLALPALPPLLS
jgi:AraC family transcriptional regulator